MEGCPTISKRLSKYGDFNSKYIDHLKKKIDPIIIDDQAQQNKLPLIQIACGEERAGRNTGSISY